MSDFVEPYPGWAQESKGRLILGVTGAMTGLAFLFVWARIYSRMISLGRLGVDDYILIISIFLSLSYIAIFAVAISYGAGRHIATIPREDIPKALFYTVISTVPGIMSFTLPKFAVVILLAKVLNPGRGHKAFMWVVSILYLLLSTGQITLNFTECRPVAAVWGGAKGTCWDRRILFSYAEAHGICSVVFDFYLAIYPTVVISRLALNWKKKLALSAALGFGYCAAVVTSYKTYQLKGLLGIQDFTYAIDDVMLWVDIEASCVIIGACIPCLHPLVKKIWGAAALSTWKGRNQKQIDANNTIITIGGSGSKKKKQMTEPLDLPQLNAIKDGSKFIISILEERPFHTSTSELEDEEAAVPEQQPQRQQARSSYYWGWQ